MEHFRLLFFFLSDLLGESAGLDGRKLLVVEVCKHAAQYGVMLKQKTQSLFQMTHNVDCYSCISFW